MHPVNIIAPALRAQDDCPDTPPNIVDGICCVTGQQTKTIDAKTLFSSNFCNIDLFRAPTSKRVGIDAYITLKYRPERMACWISGNGIFRKLKRQEIRGIVLGGCDYDIWTAYVTTSYKKHGALFSHVNKGRFGFWRFEMLDVDCRDIKKVTNYYNRINDALHDGFGRSVIESLDCPAFLLKKYGIDKWLKFYRWAKGKENMPLYKFMCYLLPSQEEIKKEKELNKYKQGDLI